MLNRFPMLVAVVAIAALALAAGAIGAVLIRPQAIQAAQTSAAIRQLTVVGTGEVKATPDTAIVQFGVQTDATTAKQALADNNAKMQAVIAKLKELGIEDKDIQTSNLSIWPRYSERGPEGGVTGYQASNSVAVTIRNVAQAGDLLEQVIDAGANYMAGMSFTIAEPATLEAAARDKAIADARARAEAMAQASGAQLDQMLTISEIVSGVSPMVYEAKATATGAGAPIQPGEQSIVRQVQVTYTLK
ncbi:MAG TPA: SIMPL domain-containing protein [Herpetosiphonaceae bacterium]